MITCSRQRNNLICAVSPTSALHVAVTAALLYPVPALKPTVMPSLLVSIDSSVSSTNYNSFTLSSNPLSCICITRVKL
ncbi:hypothetical protein BDQ17DRAFT_1377639 [Cyathus striatus]|nr:hypothetical protein BDQ17DRAFT_1377639 [Cyathus striatus]